MRRPRTLAGILAAVLIASWAAAEEPSSSQSLDATRATLQKWVEAQQTLSREKQEWQLGKDVLEQRIDLLEGEVKTLEGRVGQIAQLVLEAEKKRAEILAEKGRLASASSGLADLVLRLEAKVISLEPALPEPLRDRIEPLFRRVPRATVADLTLGQRFQNVVGILNEVNKFNADVTVVSEVRKLADGGSAEVKTVYLGLAQGFYVAASGQTAGMGRPSPSGWQWTPNDAIAPDVARVIGILERGEVPAFVSLPVTIE